MAVHHLPLALGMMNIRHGSGAKVIFMEIRDRGFLQLIS